MELKIKWLGTGSAGTTKNWTTSALIQVGNHNLLFDAGTGLQWALDEAGLCYLDINSIYISHLHADHIGGLEILGFSSYFDPAYKNKPNLYIHRSLVGRLWQSLAPGMESIQNQSNDLETYFNVHKIGKNQVFSIYDYIFKPIQVTHIVNDATHEPAFGLMITTPEDRRIFFTSDTQHCPHQLKDFYRDADVIFQDCETLPFCSGVHANFEELKELDDYTKARMYLIHYQDNVVNDLPTWQERAIREKFVHGFVEMGKEFTF